MANVTLLNKPYGTLCQFTDTEGRSTLADLIQRPGIYPAGRLDRDSEGLVVLTDDGKLQARIADPAHKLSKVYLVQVEGAPSEEALRALRAGPTLKDGPTRRARADMIDAPDWLWPRDPPVRFRATVPDRWLRVELREGRNRQVRRMTAAVGHPTLRLIRVQVGPWVLGDLPPGAWCDTTVDLPDAGPQTPKPRQTKRRPSPRRRRGKAPPDGRSG